MILNLDFYFSYKYNLRKLLINKLNNSENIHIIPNIKKINLYFNFKKLENLNDIELYNCFYLFKFFLGKKVYFTKTFSFYTLGKYYYNFNIQLIINKNNEIYAISNFLINNILCQLESNVINKQNLKNELLTIKLKNIKVFSEIKTNMALFNLENSMNINIYLLGCAKFKFNHIFIKILKI
jgi:hypothetical protein